MNEYCPESSILQILNGSLGTVPEGYFAVANESAISFSGLVSIQQVHCIDIHFISQYCNYLFPQCCYLIWNIVILQIKHYLPLI